MVREREREHTPCFHFEHVEEEKNMYTCISVLIYVKVLISTCLLAVIRIEIKGRKGDKPVNQGLHTALYS